MPAASHPFSAAAESTSDKDSLQVISEDGEALEMSLLPADLPEPELDAVDFRQVDFRQVDVLQGPALEAHALVDAARRGEPKAFEALYKRYRHRIYALALQLSGSASDADDITQDAFVQAYRHLPGFQGRSEFFTWLYRITLHRALNVKRSRARKRTEPLDDPRVTLAVAVDAGGDPQRALELRQTYAHLLEAFDNLSPILRTTVALTMMQGLSYPEVAVVLDTTEGTIAWRVHEARRLIRTWVYERTFAAGRTAPEAPSSGKQLQRSPITLYSDLATRELGTRGRIELALRLLSPQL